jgi:hypothetical protein
MTSYVISDRGKPWVTIFSSARLDAVAEAIVAQPATLAASIYATIDGLPRSLSAAERIELFERVLELRPGDETATTELSAARADSRR